MDTMCADCELLRATLATQARRIKQRRPLVGDFVGEDMSIANNNEVARKINYTSSARSNKKYFCKYAMTRHGRNRLALPRGYTQGFRSKPHLHLVTSLSANMMRPTRRNPLHHTAVHGHEPEHSTFSIPKYMNLHVRQTSNVDAALHKSAAKIIIMFWCCCGEAKVR